MKVINVSDVYNVTQISKTNNEAWEKLISVMEQETDDVLFDFMDIALEEPWNNEAFKKLLGNERVYLKVYSSEKLRDTIEMACEIGNLKTGRVLNEDEIVETAAPVKNIVLERLTKQFQDAIDIVKGVGMLNVLEVVDQIGSFDTVKSLETALERFAEVTGVKEFAVYTEYMFIQVNIIELLAKLIGKFRANGITVILLSKDKEVESKISIYQCTAANKNLTPSDKAKIFKSLINLNTVGMLSKFKDTKKLDEFGQKGEGKPIMCRVAIFKKIDKDLNLYFTTYHGKYFYTKLHYELDNDGDQLDRLVAETIKIPIAQVGLCSKYTGSLYHFNLPIQYSLDDYISTYCQDTDGEIIQTKITLPEHIQMVLRDFGIKYDEPSLIMAITDTDTYLEELRKNISENE